jgi:hypothetical protein
MLAAMKFNHVRFVWHCRVCLLMPDHLRAIIAFPRECGMQTTVKNWKKFVAGKHGVDWQRDFFDHCLRDHHELEEKTGYILVNPVRKGLCEQAEDWAWVYRPNDRPPPLGDKVGRAVLCTPVQWQFAAARTHSTSLRAGCDAPYLQKLSRQIDRPSQEAQIMVPRNFKTAKLLQVRREPLRVQ